MRFSSPPLTTNDHAIVWLPIRQRSTTPGQRDPLHNGASAAGETRLAQLALDPPDSARRVLGHLRTCAARGGGRVGGRSRLGWTLRSRDQRGIVAGLRSFCERNAPRLPKLDRRPIDRRRRLATASFLRAQGYCLLQRLDPGKRDPRGAALHHHQYARRGCAGLRRRFRRTDQGPNHGVQGEGRGRLADRAFPTDAKRALPRRRPPATGAASAAVSGAQTRMGRGTCVNWQYDPDAPAASTRLPDTEPTTAVPLAMDPASVKALVLTAKAGAS